MMPNIVKGRGVTGAIKYALSEGWAKDKKHPLAYALEREADVANENRQRGKYKTLAEGETSRVEILGGQNFGFEIDSVEKVDLARRVMEWNGKPENQASKTRKCDIDCFHASLSWEIGQNPTGDDMQQAARAMMKAIGMETAQAVFIAHHDTKHPHVHIIASRIDPVTGKTFSQTDDFTKAQVWALAYMREHGLTSSNENRRELQSLATAVASKNHDAVLGHLTARTPTFSPRELDKALSLGGLSEEARATFRGELMASANVIPLQETADAAVTRYTTRDTLAEELGMLATANKLASTRAHALGAATVATMAERFTLKPEQVGALEELTSASGLGILWGEAGTGKSHTLKAVRTAYEAEGANVVGLSWTNEVVQQMRGDGFTARTVASALHAAKNDRLDWNNNTVLIVDEAAMLATKDLAALAGIAHERGAKLILAGDDAQLASIERGGIFEVLRERHGCAILSDVQRVQDPKQQLAYNQMHKGEFKNALVTFDQAGGLHWSDRQADALVEMATAYTAATINDPDKRRFMFAATNAEVDALNDCARSIHKARGDLGDDHRLQTAKGEAVFATGDRIQFTGNGYGQRQKNAGFTNGRVGTITGIDFAEGAEQPRVTVALDTPKNSPEQVVSFIVGDDRKAGEFNTFRQGYAGTIYKGQGRTLDESYLCHSSLWRRATAYVALTRHREQVHIFASRETINGMNRDAVMVPPELQAAHALEVMAQGFSRADNTRAATAYYIDGLTLPPVTEAPTVDRRAGIEHPAQEEAQSNAARQSLQADSPRVGAVAGAALDFVGEAAERAITALADVLEGLLGGGSTPAPAPRRVAQQPDQLSQIVGDAVAVQQAMRRAVIQELSSLFGREVHEHEAREITRDRGGGISL